jgi:hypothetical protein
MELVVLFLKIRKFRGFTVPTCDVSVAPVCCCIEWLTGCDS